VQESHTEFAKSLSHGVGVGDLGWVSAIDCERRTIWIVDAHRDDGRRFVVTADEKKLSAFVELEREVLTVTFYLASVWND
jgi:hypothetical protein